MKFSAQEEYGLRCMLHMARVGGSLTIHELAEAEQLSSAHVAKLLRILRKAGLVRSTRGQNGGYQLARVPEELSVYDILTALGGRLYSEDFCQRHSGKGLDCVHSQGCSIRSLWAGIDRLVGRVLTRCMLADLVGDQHAMSDWVAANIDVAPVSEKALASGESHG